MEHLKSYNIFTALIEYWKIFAIFTIVDLFVPLFLKELKDPIGFTAFGSMWLIIIYWAVRYHKHHNIVLSYMKSSEIEMCKKYFGTIKYVTRLYVREYTPSEIEKLYTSPIGASFAECYKFPVKVAATAIYFVLLAIIFSRFYPLAEVRNFNL